MPVYWWYRSIDYLINLKIVCLFNPEIFNLNKGRDIASERYFLEITL